MIVEPDQTASQPSAAANSSVAAAAVAAPTASKSTVSYRWTRYLPVLPTPERDVLVLSTFLKILVGPSYHSTDFEVHRNWLAITRTLPLRDWYFDTTSQWTLDYPPFFAYFSYILALPAAIVDPLIVSLHDGLEYAAPTCKAYMRGTVIVTELVLGAALLALSKPATAARRSADEDEEDEENDEGKSEGELEAPVDEEASRVLAMSLFTHPGFLIIDHIHFQYNGFLFGVMLWSIWAARSNRLLLCAVLFSALLNLKHIFVYIAPAFFVFLLRTYVFPVGTGTAEIPAGLERLISLGTITLIPFGLSLVPLMVAGLQHDAGPFGVVAQMVSRLFPFSRGLNHAYWAANAWALWTAADRFLLALLRRKPGLAAAAADDAAGKLGRISAEALTSASRGIIGDTSFAVLPDITPGLCFAVTLICILAYMARLWQAPTYRNFVTSIALCGLSSFLFGWHVHEKAIMLVLVPLTLVASTDYAHFRTFILLTTAGTFALFPLLFDARETPIKLAYTVVWSVIVFTTLSHRVYRPVPTNIGYVVHGLETIYLALFPLVQLYVSVLHSFVFPAPAETLAAAAPLAASSAAAHTASMSTPQVLSSASEAIAGLATAFDTTTTGAVPSVAARIQSIASTAVSAAASAGAQVVSSPAAILASQSSPPAAAPSSGMEFLPLMLVSVYCAVGVVWSWLRLSFIFLQPLLGGSAAGGGSARPRSRRREKRGKRGATPQAIPPSSMARRSVGSGGSRLSGALKAEKAE